MYYDQGALPAPNRPQLPMPGGFTESATPPPTGIVAGKLPPPKFKLSDFPRRTGMGAFGPGMAPRMPNPAGYRYPMQRGHRALRNQLAMTNMPQQYQQPHPYQYQQPQQGGMQAAFANYQMPWQKQYRPYQPPEYQGNPFMPAVGY